MMDARTAEALEKSIEHWRESVSVPMAGMRLGPAECSLCAMFWVNDCRGCPVFERTAAESCDETPYYQALIAQGQWLSASIRVDENKMQEAESAFRAAARAELAFLESLREPVDEDRCAAYFGA